MPFRLFTLALALSGARACVSGGSSDPVILSLGDQEVRRSEFDRHLAELSRKGADPALREAFLGPFLEERVLVLEARARGLVKPGADQEEEKTAVETLLSRALPTPDVSDEEIARYYGDHADQFHRPETITLKQILVPTENEARDVRRRLQHEPKGFELLARTRSRSPEASTGGLMGRFERGQLPPELETPAFALAPGATSEIIKSPLGYHVLRLESREPAHDDPLEAVRAPLRMQLLQDKTAQAVRAFVQQLLSRAKVNHEVALSSPARA
jgi:parvulin-like peptidyl-prolyl isomerase